VPVARRSSAPAHDERFFMAIALASDLPKSDQRSEDNDDDANNLIEAMHILAPQYSRAGSHWSTDNGLALQDCSFIIRQMSYVDRCSCHVCYCITPATISASALATHSFRHGVMHWATTVRSQVALRLPEHAV
jgi:hypothetical protein